MPYSNQKATVDYLKQRYLELGDYLGLKPSNPLEFMVATESVIPSFTQGLQRVRVSGHHDSSIIDHELTHGLLWAAGLLVDNEDDLSPAGIRNTFYCYTLTELFAVMVEKRLNPLTKTDYDIGQIASKSVFLIQSGRYVMSQEKEGSEEFNLAIKKCMCGIEMQSAILHKSIEADAGYLIGAEKNIKASYDLHNYFSGLTMPIKGVIQTAHTLGGISAFDLMSRNKDPYEFAQKLRHFSGKYSYEQFYWDKIVPVLPSYNINKEALMKSVDYPIA
jgi:hypothetical protein